MTEQKWQRAESWVGAEFEDSLVMLEIDLGSYVGLNDTAAAIWAAIELPASRDDIVGFLRARFDIDQDSCTIAVTETLDRFRTVGLAVPA